MRRQDRAVTDRTMLADIIREADVCRIAFADGGIPYIVTLNFGYVWDEQLALYFHCARTGRKLELMDKNSSVCFSMDTGHELHTGATACEWGMSYRSIVGYGRLSRVVDAAERIRGLDLIMDHYGYAGSRHYDEKTVAAAEVLRLDVHEMTGKKKP